MKTIDVVLSPAEIALLPKRDLTTKTCLVLDILRATSSMVTALSHGAQLIVPVATIGQAKAFKRRNPKVLLAGERHGLPIEGFHLSNSPDEFATEKVRGRAIVMTTTNGTIGVKACLKAQQVFIASLLNFTATASVLAEQTEVVIICAGTFETVAWEDVYVAGAFIKKLQQFSGEEWSLTDSAMLALTCFESNDSNMEKALGLGRNGRRLLSLVNYSRDVKACARLDQYPIVVGWDSKKKGVVLKQLPSGKIGRSPRRKRHSSR